MPPSEYLVIPASNRPRLRSGLFTRDTDVADALSVVMNDVAADGWRYVRTDRVQTRGMFGGTRDLDLLVFVRGEEQQPARRPQAKTPPPRPAIPDHLVSPRRYGGDRGRAADSSAA